MAKDASTVESPAAPAPAEDEVFALDETPEPEDAEAALAEAEEPEKGEPEAKAAKPTPAKAEPEKAEPEKPEAAKPEKRERLSPAAREEREKRKAYARKYEQTLSERDAAMAEIERLRGTRSADLKEHYKGLVERADKAEKMGEIMTIALEEMDRRDTLLQRTLADVQYRHAVEMSQVAARQRHPDYDEALRKAGIIDAVQIDPATGTWRDPEMGRRIYLTRDGRPKADPAEEAYQLAVGKLEYEAARNNGKADEANEEPEERTPEKPGAKAPTAEDVREAERRGARQVIETVERARPKGLANLKPAGKPTAGLTRRQLDDMMEREPVRYAELCKKRPDLERWHLGG